MLTAWRNPTRWIPLALAFGMALVLTYRPHGAFEVLLGATGLVVLVACAARPLWGVCLAAMLDLYFSYVQTLGVPPRNYLLAYLVILATVRAMRGGPAIVPRSAYRLVTIAGLLIGFMTVRALMSPDDVVTVLREFAGGLGAGAAIAATTASFVDDERDAYTFVRVVTIGLVLSSLVALLQFSGVEAAWQLREMIGLDQQSGIAPQILQRERVPGLTYFSIQLSYQLVTVIPIAGSVWLASRPGSMSRLWYGLSFAALALGVAATLTRSGIAGAIAGMATVILIAVRGRRWLWLTLMVTISVIVIGVVDLGGRRSLSLEELSAERLPLFITALKIARDNPLGIGSLSQFNEHAAYYYSEIADLRGAAAVRDHTAHNQFLNMLVVLGVPGLIGLVWFYRELFRLLGRTRRAAPDGGLHTLASGLTGAFVGYVVNSSFHNAGPFLGDPFNWYWVGLAIALARMAEGARSVAGRDREEATCRG